MLLCVVFVGISFLAHLGKRNYKKPSADVKSRININGYEFNQKSIDNLKKTTEKLLRVEDWFGIYFLKNKYYESNSRKNFIEDHFTEDAKKLYMDKLKDDNLDENADLVLTVKNDYTKREEDNIKYSGIYKDENLIIVLEKTEDDKIQKVYGEGWTELSEEIKQEYINLFNENNVVRNF